MHILHEVCVSMPNRGEKYWSGYELSGNTRPEKSLCHQKRKRDVYLNLSKTPMNNTRIEEEKTVVEQMIRLYCRKREGNAQLCPTCWELLDYAHRRLDRCRYGEDKPTCKKCPIHCYKPEMKERIRMVMRWSGPRMMLYHPLAAIGHLFREMMNKK